MYPVVKEYKTDGNRECVSQLDKTKVHLSSGENYTDIDPLNGIFNHITEE